IAPKLARLCAENGVDMIRKAGYDVQQLSFPRRPVVGHARLDHMARAIELMAFRQIAPSSSRLFKRIVSIEVAILLLSLGDDLDHFVCRALQLGIRLRF